jgi:hypothetical protein
MPKPVTVFGRDLVDGNLLLRDACHCKVVGPSGPKAFQWRTGPWGTQWGQLDRPGGFRFVLRPLLAPPELGMLLLSRTGTPDHVNYSASPLGRTWWLTLLTDGGLHDKIVTWLILPVVICLSQRLSHACLSISNYTVKLRMAH